MGEEISAEFICDRRYEDNVEIEPMEICYEDMNWT
jgi:hypothetical protein